MSADVNETEQVEETPAPAEPEKLPFDAETAFGSLSEKLDKLLEKPAPRRRTKPRVKIEPAPEKTPADSTASTTSESAPPSKTEAPPVTDEAKADAPAERRHRYGSRRWFGERALEPTDG